MAIVRFTPMSLVQQVQNEMNRIFEQNLSSGFPDASHSATSQWIPSVDIKEEKDHFLVLADLPGLQLSDIEMSCDHQTLTLQGTRTVENKEEKQSFVRVERSSGSFYRQFTFPDTANMAQIQAKYKNGVLEVHIPKKETQKARKIEITQEER